MALTEAPQWFREGFQYELKSALRKLPQVEILDFVGLEAGTESDVYLHDCTCTEIADLCVFVVDFPSTGLGMEIERRRSTGKKMLIFARPRVKVTRMIGGLCAVENVEYIRYAATADIVDRVRQELEL